MPRDIPSQEIRETALALVQKILRLGNKRLAEHLRKCLAITLDGENLVYEPQLDPDSENVDISMFMDALEEVRSGVNK